MKTKIFFLFVLVLIGFSSYGQRDKSLVRKGNQAFEKNDLKNAELKYRKSLDINKKQEKAKFNLGDVMYLQKNFDEATKHFEGLTENKNKSIKKNAYYNLGNTFLSQKKYEESIDAYKNALKIDPNDENARYNLVYAQEKLKKQQQQQQQKQQNKKQDQNDQQNKQNQDKQDKQDKDQDKQDQKDKDKQDQNKQDQNKQKQKQPQKQEISKKDAQRILKALENNEKKTLEKLKQQKAQQAKSRKVEKDW
ncbi:MAG: tetratricopeptide repeat protein [Bacteroidales bacterium]